MGRYWLLRHQNELSVEDKSNRAVTLKVPEQLDGKIDLLVGNSQYSAGKNNLSLN